jgi:hypothetical protein
MPEYEYTGEQAWKSVGDRLKGGTITIVKLGPGNKEQTSVNTPM